MLLIGVGGRLVFSKVRNIDIWKIRQMRNTSGSLGNQGNEANGGTSGRHVKCGNLQNQGPIWDIGGDGCVAIRRIRETYNLGKLKEMRYFRGLSRKCVEFGQYG